MQSNFRLVIRSGPSVGKIFVLDKNELFLGRDLSNDIVINDPEISRRHSRFYQQGSGYVVEDLGSTNGTFVNGQRLMGPNVLRPGDVITFGERMSLVFEASGFDQDATLASPASHPAYGGQEPAPVYQAPPQPSYAPPPPAYSPPQPSGYPQQNYPPPAAQPSRPVDSYAGQVPQAYAPEAAEPRRAPVIWIIIGVILLLACLCLAAFLFFAPVEFWCALPIDWESLGGTCP